MPNNNLTDLEKHIRNSIPRLMELSEGCEIEPKNQNSFIIDTSHSIRDKTKTVVDEITQERYDSDNYTIIGHPILLNDVLEWLNITIGMWNYKCGQVYNAEYILRQWNLSKPKLSEQSKELINALCDLIPK